MIFINWKADISSNKLRQTSISINPLTVCSSKLSNRQLCAGQLAPSVHDSCQVKYIFFYFEYSISKLGKGT